MGKRIMPIRMGLGVGGYGHMLSLALLRGVIVEPVTAVCLGRATTAFARVAKADTART